MRGLKHLKEDLGLQQILCYGKEVKLQFLGLTRLSLCDCIYLISNCNNCWGSKVKRGIFALWFEYPWKNFYHHITENQIQKSMIKEDYRNGIRKQRSKLGSIH